MSPSTAVEQLNTNDTRRPSKIRVKTTMEWSQDPVVMGQASSLHKAGVLKKKGSGKSFLGRRNWNERYFVLNNGTIGYWKNKREFETNQPPIKGSKIEVSQCEVTAVDSEKYIDQFPFKISVMEEEIKELFLMAPSAEERQGWINLIKMSSGNTETEAAVL